MERDRFSRKHDWARDLAAAGGAALRGLRNGLAIAVCATIGGATVGGAAMAQAPADGNAAPKYLAQSWTDQDRLAFYTTNQGSRIMPLRWFKALRRRDGSAFLPDGLARYGYLRNTISGKPADLPVGFTLDTSGGETAIGMNCAACHTRQIEWGSVVYRIDGGPALVDFQSFLADLDAAVASVLEDGAQFDRFARQVLAGGYSAHAAVELRLAVTDWYGDYDELLRAALPPQPGWGIGRLDAVGMIFNRLAGLDLNIPGNIRVADAPVRYPFLWNAARQDKTQWPGFAPNGNDLLAMVRNTGEVFGVFGVFHPKPLKPFPWGAPHIDYLSGSSANFGGLQKLETEIRKLDPPPWPEGWPLDETVIDRGAAVFEKNCAPCHQVKPGDLVGTWKTPVQNVATDDKAWNNLQGEAASGVLAGTQQPPVIGQVLGATADEAAILGNAVIGTLLQDLWTHRAPLASRKRNGTWQAVDADFHSLLSTNIDVALIEINVQIKDAFAKPPKTSGAAYESRVMRGIWAAAPYLHNGSVQSLAELLTPLAVRRKSFAVGPAYDPVAVGLANEQPGVGTVFTVGPCTGPDGGNGNCGHEFGTDLPIPDKHALIEYLKKL